MNDDIYIPQAQFKRLESLLRPGRVTIIYGPRRVGKTTLLRQFIQHHRGRVLFVTGEDVGVREYLESQSVTKLKSFVGENEVLIIDEAQHIKDVGLNLKMLVDHVPGLCIMATGSSSFDLSHQTGEPLTGRKTTLLQLPLAQMEIGQLENAHETAANLEFRLIYGSYPEVVLETSNDERAQYLAELVSSYLLKDILHFEGIRQSDKLLRLLQLLAFQIGQDVSVSELGTSLGLNKNTVERYLDLLEKVFVIYSRTGFSRNLRKEITKNRRYYFYDNGVRNALINNFNLLQLRADTGQLWENYVLSERTKFNLYHGHRVQSHFWRTYDQQEIDLVEEAGGALSAYEMKWTSRSVRAPVAWSKAYPGSTYRVIDRTCYLDFIVPVNVGSHDTVY